MYLSLFPTFKKSCYPGFKQQFVRGLSDLDFQYRSGMYKKLEEADKTVNPIQNSESALSSLRSCRIGLYNLYGLDLPEVR